MDAVSAKPKDVFRYDIFLVEAQVCYVFYDGKLFLQIS